MSCPSCGRENPAENAYCGACGRPLGVRAPSAYTPRHLTERILASRSALEGERKQVTVLFADVKGSTALAASVGPEEWHRVLDGFFAILTEGVHRFEGTVNQYTGDGIMALFGAPLAHEDHARRACETALHLAARLEAFQRELAEAGLEFGVRMGLHSGEVVVGKIGDDLRMDYTAQGAAVALAARIEELADPGRILVSEDTAELVRGQFDWAELGPQPLRGFPEPRQVFELLGSGAGRTRLEVSAATGLSPLVGRAPQLEALTGWLAEARAGQGAVVEVVGEAGMGKSRLCLELLEHCAREGVRASEVACPSHGHALPFLAIRLLLRACFGIREGDAPERVRRKVERLLSGLRSDFTAQFGALLVLLEFEGDAAPPVGPEAHRRALAEFVRKLVQAWSATEPIVLIIDDAHWIDAESQGLVAEMIDGLGWTRTLLVLSSRPQDGLPWPQVAYTRRIDLEPLDAQQTDALLTTLLGADASLDPLRARIAERAAGNPYFAEEIVRSLAQRGALLGEPGAYQAIASDVSLVLPESVRSLLAARIDQLGERDKQVLQVGAAIGHFRDRELLARVASLEGAAVEDSHGALVAAGLVRDGAFAHPLTREVATLTQLTVHRQAVHAELARALEALHPDELGRQAELIAHHWASAGDARRARRWSRRAALRVSNIQVRR